MSGGGTSKQQTLQGPLPCVLPQAGFIGRWRYHALILSVSAAVFTAASLLHTDGNGAVALPLFGALPGVCTWQRLFATACPGCGLTRSFVSLAHGDLSAAWKYNPAGLLMFAVLLYQFPFRGIQLWRLAHGQEDYRHSAWAIQFVVWAIVVALLAQWAAQRDF